MIYNKWLSEKPKFNKDCILITASKYKDKWNYTSYRIELVEGEDENFEKAWYWGWLDMDGSEIDDINDMVAQKYMVIKPIKNKQP